MGSVENFTASTDAELKLYSPSVTDFIIVVKRKELGEFKQINTVLVCGGYRNCDFIDYTDSGVSFMFNLGAGGGAILLKKNYGKNLLLGTHLMSDGSVVHTCGSKVGGILEPVTPENYKEFGMLRLMDSPKMKGLLNTVSMPNWYHCIDEALRKSGKTRSDIDYLDILHIERKHLVKNA